MNRELLKGAGRLAVMAAALSIAVGAPALAAGDKPEKKQKARQVHPTGAEDAKAPTLEELQGEAAVEQMTNRSSEGLVAVEHESGMVSVDLEGRFMSVMVANPRKGGTPGATCVSNHDELAKVRKQAKAAPARATAAPKPEPKTAPLLEEK
jgi:hypothetical protein